jgi:branched-chain amino acid transport system ATP-binding protein
VLDVRDVRAGYGRLEVLRGLSLEVPEGRVVTMLGANGAGKTTALRVIAGLLRPTAGRVTFQGRPITGLRPDRIVRRGVALVPETRELFLQMTVDENLELGAFTRRDGRVRDDVEAVFALFPRLRERRRQRAGTLSGGEQQMLAIARAWLARPRLLLLDEPSLGLAPALVDEIFERIDRIRREGTTVLLVEQNARLALEVADWGYVLETGRVVLSGNARDLADDRLVRESYLGRDGR